MDTTGLESVNPNNAETSTKKDKGITKKELEELILKYDLELVSDEKATSLNLDKQSTKQLKKSMTKDEVEQYIVDIKDAIEKPVHIVEDVYHDENDSDSSTKEVTETNTKIATPMSLGAGTKSVTSTKSSTGSYLTDFTLRKAEEISVATKRRL